MTGLVFLTAALQPASAPIDSLDSLVWLTRYYTPGSFSAKLPASKYINIKNAVYVYNPDNGGCAVFDRKVLTITGDTAEIGGSSLEALLNMRTVLTETKLAGNIETVCRALVTTNALTGARVIPNLALGTAAGHTETVDTVVEAGVRLSDALYAVLRPFGMSYTITLDYTAGTFNFEIVKGLDRTQSQSVNSWAIFSTDFENIKNASYEKIEADYANYAYVTAEDATHGIVVIGVNESTGPDRREIYISSNATSVKADESVMTLNEYKNLLASVGYEALAKNAVTENANGDIDTAGSLEYGVNYSLGDWCDIIVAEHGLSWEAQITALDEVYEKGSKRIIPAFGEELISNLKDFIKKEIKNEPYVSSATSLQYEDLEVLSEYIKLRDANNKVVYDSAGNRVCVENSILGAGVYKSAYKAVQMDNFITTVTGA